MSSSKAPDTVVGLVGPCINQFELWGSQGKQYQSGDKVPSVGMAETYSVQHWELYNGRPLFLWVQEGKITNLAAHQPIGERSVFDPNGKYLGRGGHALDELQKPRQEKVNLLDLASGKTMAPAAPSLKKPESPKVSDPQVFQETLEHRFWVREGCEVVFRLPADLTKKEAQRLSSFVKRLPF